MAATLTERQNDADGRADIGTVSHHVKSTGHILHWEDGADTGTVSHHVQSTGHILHWEDGEDFGTVSPHVQ